MHVSFRVWLTLAFGDSGRDQDEVASPGEEEAVQRRVGCCEEDLRARGVQGPHQWNDVAYALGGPLGNHHVHHLRPAHEALGTYFIKLVSQHIGLILDKNCAELVCAVHKPLGYSSKFKRLGLGYLLPL